MTPPIYDRRVLWAGVPAVLVLAVVLLLGGRGIAGLGPAALILVCVLFAAQGRRWARWMAGAWIAVLGLVLITRAWHGASVIGSAVGVVLGALVAAAGIRLLMLRQFPQAAGPSQ
jgi:hypothetical protein